MFQVFENPDTLLRSFDLEAVLQKLCDSMRQQYPLVRDIFRRRVYPVDPQKTIGSLWKIDKTSF